MSQRTIKRPAQPNPENIRMELFNMYQKLGELWKTAGDTFALIPNKTEIAYQCWLKSGSSVQNAAEILSISAQKREAELNEIKTKDEPNEPINE